MSEFVGSTLKEEDIAYFCHAVYVAEVRKKDKDIFNNTKPLRKTGR